MVLNMFFRGSFPEILQSPINCGVVAMLGGLVIVPVVSIFTPKLKKEKVEGMFACYDKQVTVQAKESLGNQ